MTATRETRPGTGARARERVESLTRRIDYLARIRRFAAESDAYTWLRESIFCELPELRTVPAATVRGTPAEHVAALSGRLSTLDRIIIEATENEQRDHGAERERKAILWAFKILRNRFPEIPPEARHDAAE